MKAVIFPKYGSPDVLEYKELDMPRIKDDQVLVKIRAASFNAGDWRLMRGAPFLVRMDEGWGKPKNPRIGNDLAGEVVATGKDVTEFKVGDEVYGASRGSFAEYVSSFGKSLVPKPANLTFEEAAAVPIAAITALQALRDYAKVENGQKVLINGAAGGVGTFTVQLARYYGAEVTAVCSTRNVEMVRALGADHVIDYTRADFTRNGQQYDVIIDNVGNRSLFAMRRVMTPDGNFVGIGAPSGHITPLLAFVRVKVLSPFFSQKLMMALAKLNKPDLLFLKELLEAGKIKAIVDRCYPLSETAEAMRYVETGHASAKVVISMEGLTS